MDKKEYLVRNRGCDDTTIHFDLERKFEKIEGDYADEYDYTEKTEDYYGDIKKLNGILYRLEW